MRIPAAAAVAALLLSSVASSAAFAAPKSSSGSMSLRSDGALVIAGRTLRCGNVRNVLDRRAPDMGIAGPGVLILNPGLLSRQSETVRLFVYSHECGHHRMGASEIKADCWAVNKGVREGWLDKAGLTAVCKSLRGASDPPHAVRCRELDRCFATAMAAREKTQPPQPAPQITANAARPLVSGPTLVREGVEGNATEPPLHGFGAGKLRSGEEGGR